jgi:hypothetical protein
MLEIELAGSLDTVEEIVKQVGDRTGLEAIGFIPVERRAVRSLDRLDEAAVVRDYLETLVVLPFDDCSSDRKCIEQAEIVRSRQMRSRIQSVRPTEPLNSRRPGRCSLHFRIYGDEGLILGIFLRLLRLINSV